MVQTLKRFSWTWELSKKAICDLGNKMTPTTRGAGLPKRKMKMTTIGIEALLK